MAKETAYTFGDQGDAARRLALLAQVYESEMRAFLQSASPPSVGLAVDLGCGSGHTTRLVAEVTGAADTYGIDRSQDFLTLARAAAVPGTHFLAHDVTEAPLPFAEVDLLFCHLLLTHLPDAASAIRIWLAALAPTGRLLIDEVERIETPDPGLREYLAIVAALVASRGGELYIGAKLEAMPVPQGFARLPSEIVSVPVTRRDAASLFLMNLRTWRGDPFIARTVDPRTLVRIERELERGGSQSEPDITWFFRQIVYARVASGRT